MTPDESEFRAGPAPGSPLPECPLIANGKTRHITELLPDGFVLLAYTDTQTLPPDMMDELRSAASEGLPLSLLVVTQAKMPHQRFRWSSSTTAQSTRRGVSRRSSMPRRRRST